MSVFRAFCLRSRNGILTHIQSQPSMIKVLQPLFYKLRNDVHFKHLAGSASSFPQKAPKKTPSPYDSMIRKKRDEAERSILVQVQSAMSHPELYSYISQFASVEQMYHYSFSDDMQFILVELSSAEDVERILDASGHLSQGDLIPVRSPLLWFRAKGGGSSLKSKSRKKSKNIENVENLPPLKCGCITLSEGDIMKSVSSSSSFSEQVQVLYKLSCLDELGSRLRFLTARQLELALQGIFPNAKAIPFGSSVNGFGRVGCDLDLSLHLDSCEREEEDGNPTSLRLIFQTKMIPVNGRAQMQRQMEAVGDILQLFLPGCTHVRRILQARVPIVKYHQDFTSLECDVTMSNQTAVFMSELLWTMGSLDARVRPLVFTVRHWAKAVRLTNASPGPFITNFTLTLLVLHYLQCCQPHPVLPSLTTLISMAAAGDRRVSDDGVNCTFLRDMSRVKPSENTESLHALLFGFFQFYASFNFEGRGLSLARGHGGDGSGVGIVKPDASPLYVENPLERMLNVSKNVNGQELERLRIEMRSAAWLMEEMLALSDDEAQEVDTTRASHIASKSASDGALSWGLMDLLSPSNAKVKDNRLSVGTAMKINAKGRLVRVTDLFKETERDDSRVSHSVARGAHKGRKR